jgi:cytochrome c oxidase subunit III
MSSANPTVVSHGHASAGDGHAHSVHLAHHFDTPEQQNTAAKLGMWVFLGTEILMFGGLFCAYSIFRHNHPAVFAFAAEAYLNTKLGALNTVILITSSLTMAWGVRAAQMNNRNLTMVCLVLTLLGAAGFMVVKSVEYTAKWKEDVWIGQWNKYNAMYEGKDPEAPPQQPGPVGPPVVLPTVPANVAKPTDANTGNDVSMIQPRFNGPTGLAPAGPEASPFSGTPEEIRTERYRDLSDRDQWRVSQFFSIYFLMTGLHGLHVLIGMGLITWLLIKTRQGTFSSEYYTPVDLIGLYWHLVDLIWIFLFPLLYLIH